jgi:hypothetical protein
MGRRDLARYRRRLPHELRVNPEPLPEPEPLLTLNPLCTPNQSQRRVNRRWLTPAPAASAASWMFVTTLRTTATPCRRTSQIFPQRFYVTLWPGTS